MSHPMNSNVNFCDICNFSFNSMKDFLKHALSSGHQKITRDMIMDLDEAETAPPPQPQPKHKSAPPPVGEKRLALHKPKPKPITENMERVYDPEEDDYILVPKKVLPELKRASPPAKPQIVVQCWVCGQNFKKYIGLHLHMKKHWRENVAQDNNFNIKSSFNQKQLFITKSDDCFIKDVNEPIGYILDEFKPFKSYKYRVTANCVYKKRTPDGGEGASKTIKINLRTDEYMTKDHRVNLNQWLDHVKET